MLFQRQVPYATVHAGKSNGGRHHENDAKHGRRHTGEFLSETLYNGWQRSTLISWTYSFY
jgi:hypothetical protein